MVDLSPFDRFAVVEAKRQLRFRGGGPAMSVGFGIAFDHGLEFFVGFVAALNETAAPKGGGHRAANLHCKSVTWRQAAVGLHESSGVGGPGILAHVSAPRILIRDKFAPKAGGNV